VIVWDQRFDNAHEIRSLNAAITELKQNRRFIIYGSFWLLTPVTSDHQFWAAYQYHLDNAGIVLFFRRHRSPYSALSVSLYNIDSKGTYEIHYHYHYHLERNETVRGETLMSNFTVYIHKFPASLLLRYSRID